MNCYWHFLTLILIYILRSRHSVCGNIELETTRVECIPTNTLHFYHDYRHDAGKILQDVISKTYSNKKHCGHINCELSSLTRHVDISIAIFHPLLGMLLFLSNNICVIECCRHPHALLSAFYRLFLPITALFVPFTLFASKHSDHAIVWQN